MQPNPVKEALEMVSDMEVIEGRLVNKGRFVGDMVHISIVDLAACIRALTAAVTEIDVPELVGQFVNENDSESYPFNGEEYDLKLVTFAFEWLAHHLLSKYPERFK